MPEPTNSADPEGWETYRRLVQETHKRHNDWLHELSEKLAKLETAHAVLATKVALYAALASAVVSLAVSILSKVIGK